jgi:hypothetical protein
MNEIKILESSMSSLESSMSSWMPELHDMTKILLDKQTHNSSTTTPPNVTPVVKDPFKGAL